MSESERLDRLAREMEEFELDRLVVCAPVNVRYITGFTGSNALALIASTMGKERHFFFTDFRYQTQAAEEVSDAFEIVIAPVDVIESAAQALAEEAQRRSPAAVRAEIGFEEATITYARHARLRELLPPRWKMRKAGCLIQAMREVKDESEIARIRAAAGLADEAMREVLEGGLVGRTERDVAIDLETRMRRLGAQSASFPSIVASGARGALPHAEPSAAPIPGDSLVTIDWGAQLDGYCSDCTRTYATGNLSSEASEVYELVRSAQQAALEGVRAGAVTREVDAIARDAIERAGHGEHFGHGLGHGVGLEVHEGPRLSHTAPEKDLLAGNVVTIEPGVYLPDRLGVRIEDLTVVTDEGCEVLTGLSKDLTVIA
jgi:Xaa-Pro aminopeptidase